MNSFFATEYVGLHTLPYERVLYTVGAFVGTTPKAFRYELDTGRWTEMNGGILFSGWLSEWGRNPNVYRNYAYTRPALPTFGSC